MKRTVVTHSLPEKCPEAFPENEEMRTVRLLMMDHQTIWLALEDVDWAIKYLYAQYQVQGVPVLAPDDAGPQDGGEAAGAD